MPIFIAKKVENREIRVIQICAGRLGRLAGRLGSNVFHFLFTTIDENLKKKVIDSQK